MQNEARGGGGGLPVRRTLAERLVRPVLLVPAQNRAGLSIVPYIEISAFSRVTALI